MHLINVCLKCSTINVRKCVCICGLTATKSKRIAMQANRAVESIAETTLRQEKYSVSKLQTQALETAEDSFQQKRHIWHEAKM